MICVYAGNQVDAEGAALRFPRENVAWMQERLVRLLRALAPTAVVGAAAAGADLLVLEAARQLSIPAHLVLPFPVEEFEQRSVADRGAEWRARFRRVLAGIPASQRRIGPRPPVGTDRYRLANHDILAAAEQISGADAILALAVRPPVTVHRPTTVRRPADVRPPSDGSVTDDFVDRAREQQLTVIDLDPSTPRRAMLSAFVVMPHGVRAAHGQRVDGEATFNKIVVPALEDADLDWFRADREVDTGLLSDRAIDRLARSDVVVVDTRTANPRVYDELAARQRLAQDSTRGPARGSIQGPAPGLVRRTTLLIGPEGGPEPVAVTMLERLAYRLTGTAPSDPDALRGIAELGRFLSAATS